MLLAKQPRPVTEFKVPKSFKTFNKLIGLPQHPATLQPMDLMPWQYAFEEIVRTKKEYHQFHINKSRQIGVTELMLRILAFNCFNKYKGFKIMIIAGTREKTTAKIMRRFKALFRNIPDSIAASSSELTLELVNGTRIEGLPSNSEAIRGDTKIKAVLVDEAAHFKREDDSIVIDAIEPIVFTNKADLFLVSTPNGRRGFFYDIAHGENEYWKEQWNYTKAQGWIYSEAEIKKELKRTDVDVAQEYMCQFTTTHSAVFTEEMLEEARDDLHKTVDLRKMLGYTPEEENNES